MSVRALSRLSSRAGAALILLVLVEAVGTARQSPAQASIGAAMAWRGEWMVQRGTSSTPLEAGNRLPPGAILRPPGTPANAFVKVVYRDGQFVHFECPRDCGAPIRLKTTVAPAPSAWSARWEDLQRLFWGNPESYRPTITRGDSVDRDQVVRLDADCIDIAKALVEVLPGTYRVSLRPVALGQPTDDRSFVDGELDWDGTACVNASPLLTPGLYEVEVKQGRTADAVDPFWVLFLRSERYVSAAGAYKDATSVLEGVDTPQRRAMLRAFIDQLARESSR